MIVLDNLSNSELRKAIEFNFMELLNNDPDKFDEYFKIVYRMNNNMARNIFIRIANYELAEKYPNIVFNIFKFILVDKKDYYGFRDVSIILYKNNKEEYLDLLKVALNNCTSMYSVESLLKAVTKKTNDSYFLSIAKLLVDKSKEHINAHNIFSNINDISNLQEIYLNWDEYCNTYYQHSIYNLNDIESKKDILCKKLYNKSFKEMYERYYQYIIANRTNEIDRKIVWFERSLMSTSKEEIIQIYNETINIGNELKTTYEDIAAQIDIDSKKSISQASKYEVSEELKVKTIQDIDIYDISESNFNLIIHNVSAGLSIKHREISGKLTTDFSFWGDHGVEGSITISASEISNKFLGHVKNNKPEIIFAFSNIPEEEVFFFGIHDMGINISVKNYSELSPSDGLGQHFLANQLMTNCFHDYNEIVINRFNDKTKTQKRMPNYIVCYDEVNELSLNCAEYFNIPILFIDTKKCAYKNAAEIKQKLENDNNANSLLNNINEYFSFICGLKYSNVVYEISDLYNWEKLIINSIMNVVNNAKNMHDMKEELMIITFIEKNIPEYLNGIESRFSNYDADYSRITSKFANFLQKISNIKEIIYNDLAQEDFTLLNNTPREFEEIQSSRMKR